MITTPTTLVLGAGASCEYGFPLGRPLLFEICESLAKPESPQRKTLTELRRSIDEIEQFRVQLLNSSQMSIDAFLGHRSNFRSIGKEAIACQLIPCEDERRLFRSKENMKWYEYLFSKLSADATAESFMNNKLSIITFNYDRSLEHYIYRSLMNCYGLNSEQAVPLLQSIPIVHVYGKLGELDYVNPQNGRAYSYKLNADVVSKCAQTIKVLQEDEPNSKEFMEAHELISEARTICFLGFAYHLENMKRLVLEQKKLTGKACFCSAYGMKAAEIRSVQSQWFEAHATFGYPVQDTLEFIREHVILI